MNLLSIVWNVDPTLFHLGPMQIRYYGLLWATGLVLCYIMFQRFFKEENLSEELLDRLTLYVVLGTIIGARLGHCLFYEPAYYLSNPIDILKIWEGGLASHGCAIGIVASLFLFKKYGKSNLSMWWLLDRIGIVVAITGALVRIGNLMNSEIYGTVTSLPWGFVFTREGETLPKHPTQLYEALAYLALFGLLCFLYYKKHVQRKPGVLFGIFLIILFLARFLIEFIKNPQTEFENSMILNMGQLLSIPFILAGIYIIYYAIKQSKKAE
jgi:prolipoprotein diacylglyceryl transferase